MKTFGISALLLLFLASCGGDGDAFVSDAKKIVAEMCECTDEACGDKVSKKRRALQKKARSKYKKKEDIPASLKKAMKAVDKDFRACRKKLRETLRANKATKPATP